METASNRSSAWRTALGVVVIAAAGIAVATWLLVEFVERSEPRQPTAALVEDAAIGDGVVTAREAPSRSIPVDSTREAESVDREPVEVLHADEVRLDSLVLTASELRFHGEPVVQVRDLLRDEYLNIPALESTLKQLTAERPGTNPCATIRLDAGLTWRVLRRVLFTCARAGQVVGLALPDGTVVAGPSTPPAEQRLLVFMARDGFRMWDARWSKRFPPDDVLPLPALLSRLEPNTALALKPDDDTPATDVVKTYQTLRLAGHRVSLN